MRLQGPASASGSDPSGEYIHHSLHSREQVRILQSLPPQQPCALVLLPSLFVVDEVSPFLSLALIVARRRDVFGMRLAPPQRSLLLWTPTQVMRRVTLNHLDELTSFFPLFSRFSYARSKISTNCFEETCKRRTQTSHLASGLA